MIAESPRPGTGSTLAAVFATGVLYLLLSTLGFAWMVSGCGQALPLPSWAPMTIYAAALILPGGLAVQLLRSERFGIWRGVALTLTLAGGHSLLTGGFQLVHCDLPWPGLPAWLPPLGSLAYSIAIAIATKSFRPRVSYLPVVFGLALGLILSFHWVLIGSLGIPAEALAAGFEALAGGLVSTVLLKNLFFYDKHMLERHPFWSVMLIGTTFWALVYGLLAPRAYPLQSLLLSIAFIPMGFAAGALLALENGTELGGRSWTALALFFIAFLLPFAWTEGFEAEWMPEISLAWAVAALLGLLSGALLSLLLLVFGNALSKLIRRTAFTLSSSLSAFALLAILYVVFGQPGFQAETFFRQKHCGTSVNIYLPSESVNSVKTSSW